MQKSIIRHIFCLFSILLLVVNSSCSHSDTEKKHSVIVILSYEPEYNGYSGIEKKIKHEFECSKINTDIHFFYLDCESFQDPDELKRMYSFLDTIQSRNPETILVFDDQATYSLLACQHSLTKKVPIVFAGVNFPNWNLIKKYPNVTGFWDKPEFMKTSEMSNKIFGPMRINFWIDNTYLGRQCQQALLKELKENDIIENDTISIFRVSNYAFYLSKDSTNNNQEVLTIKEKPKKTIYSCINSRAEASTNLLWSLSGLARYAIFVQSKRDFSTKRLGLFADNPTLTVINEAFGCGEGLLGGYITPQETEIKLSVETITNILNGADVSTMPITRTPKEYILDWAEIKRWNIPITSIPREYQIINMPFFDRYKSYIIVSSIIFGILLILLFSYLLHLYLGENRKRQQAQDKLKSSERFLSLSLAGGKVFAFQLKNDAFHFDPDFYVSAGIKEEPVSLKTFRSCIYPKDRALFNQNVSDAYKGYVKENISRIRCKFSGTAYQWWEFRYTYNKDEDIFSGLCLNIQKAKEAEQELINARKKAEESDKMKSAFLANMSHEIRTPLNAIVGFSNIIGTEEVELSADEKKEFLKLINTNCELLLKLINDILDLSRIESGRIEFSFNECNLTELLGEVFQTHQLLMPANVTLKIEQPEKPVFIQTDRHRLTQVVTNFINNAGKFTKSGYIKIGYSLDENQDFVNLFVEDTGIGIPKEKQKSVFERFNKLNEFAQGTGLGLAICQVIIQHFGGSIQLISEEGKGSCFTIKLPINGPIG